MTKTCSYFYLYFFE